MRRMAGADLRAKRPLSPHLTIYKPIPTMVMSIAHRITGAALYFGALLLVWGIAAAASGETAWNTFVAVTGSWIGLVVLFGFSFALIHHMLGGLRHLVWDTGRLFDKQTATKLAYVTIAGSLTLTILLWIVIAFAS
jgi:succinate dehydrogenase / fumarate reductase cytochrome b subunit